ncbi:MAG TPA: Fic family protein [Deferribacteraceae bacterium]|nr:Fic family protein [Deferribacteraceae bacterium]
MKLPQIPPQISDIAELDHDRLFDIFMLNVKPVDEKGRYLHWDEIIHKKSPDGFTKDEYWLAIKNTRLKISSHLAFKLKNQTNFSFCIPEPILKLNSYIDKHACGTVDAPKELNEGGHKERFLVSSIIEEAIRSSQLEGASTTRDAAKKMILSDSKPKDKSQQMIMNNYRAMQFIKDKKDESLTPELIFEIHRILTENTLENPLKAGTFRTDEDSVTVVDNRDGATLHIPPKAGELPNRIKVLCDFINKEDEDYFIFPIMKSIILHFMIGYDHPFIDGNGRTARALFYWSALKYGYWIIEFISISQILKKAPSQYAKSYLYTETDGGDVTYFIIHQMEVIKQAIENMYAYIIRKTNENSATESVLRSAKIKANFNHRQIDLFRKITHNPNSRYTIAEHKNYHNITYETARTDLLELEKLGFMKMVKFGRTYVFIPQDNLMDKLKNY